MSNNQSVEIINVGTELLLGNILNSNAKWLAENLAELGIEHYRQTVIGDNFDRLKQIILEASQRSRIVITTGGLGPTPDDITTEAIASAFGVNLTENKYIVEDIKNKMGSSFNLPKSNLKQAFFPPDAEIIYNPSGTAPGMIWSPTKFCTILTFPGVPSEMKKMWELTARNWLIINHPSKRIFTSTNLKFTGISESALVEKIPNLINKKNPTVAPYASLGEVKIRITAKSKDTKEGNILISPIANELINKFEHNFFGRDKETLSSVVIDLLRQKKQTIAVAESCTGGLLAASLTAIPGSSDVFLGGVVAYNNLIKENILGVPKDLLTKHGAVSEPVVQSMAFGIQKAFKTDWAIGISGIAGPSGGTLSKPIGNVEFYISGPKVNQSIQEKFGSFRDRAEIQKLSVVRALDQVRLFLLCQS